MCVDDGSTDASPLILDDYARRDHRIKVFHVPNGGVSSARNIGLSYSVGEYIVFVDSDDALTPTFIEHGIAAMQRPSCRIDCWVAQRYYVDESYRKMDRQPQKVGAGIVECPLMTFLHDYSRFYLFCVWGKMLRRALIQSCRLSFPVEVSHGEDELFMKEYFACSHVVEVSADDWCVHCEREGSLARDSMRRSITDIFAVIRYLVASRHGNGALKLCAAYKALGIIKNGLVRDKDAILLGYPEFKQLVCPIIVKYGPGRYKIAALLLWILPVHIIHLCKRILVKASVL